MGKRESNRSLPAFRLERSQKHYRRRQHVGSAEMYACQTFGSRLFAAFSARLSFLTPRLGGCLDRPQFGLGKDSLDGRRLMAARLKQGDSYSLDVTDPGFQTEPIKEVEITLYFRIDTTCTIKTFYQSKSGPKLGNTTVFQLEDKPFWKEYQFKVSGTDFGSDEDLRIEAEGESPLLAMVIIASLKPQQWKRLAEMPCMRNINAAN